MDLSAIDTSQQHRPPPLVSVLMVCRNVDRFIDDAIWSVRRQTVTDLEIVIVNDKSTDRSLERMQAHAALDPRVVVVQGSGTGLTPARNLSLSSATGSWVAIVDGDDLLHPRYLAALLEGAARSGAEIVACDMVSFERHRPTATARRFAGPTWRQERWIDLPTFIQPILTDATSLGYLKPLIDRSFLQRHGIAYDNRLRIGEDYDLIVKALAAGARYLFLPDAYYFYRRHAASTSHRMSRSDITSLIEASRGLDGMQTAPDVTAAQARRMTSLQVGLAFLDAVEAAKARRPVALAKLLGGTPAVGVLLYRAMVEGLTRRVKQRLRPTPAPSGRLRPQALMLGTPGPDSKLEQAAAALQAGGYDVLRRATPTLAEGPGMADGLPLIDVILASDAAAVDAAPFALSPRALCLVPAGVPPFDGALALMDFDEGTAMFTTISAAAARYRQPPLAAVKPVGEVASVAG